MLDWTRLAIKYRPKTIADTWIPSEVARLLNALIHAECVHVLVTGEPGVGKTTLIRAVISAVYGGAPPPDSVLDVLSLGAMSTANQKDRIKTFCGAPAKRPKRVIVFDDLCTLPVLVQEAVRSAIDAYGAKVNFIGSCSRPSAVSPALLQRLLRVPIPIPTACSMAGLFDRICAAEGIRAEPGAKAFILRSSTGIRDMVQQLEKVCLHGGTVTTEVASACFSRIHPSRLRDLSRLAERSDGGYKLAQAMYSLYDEGHSVMDILEAFLSHIRNARDDTSAKSLLPVISRAVRMYHGSQENEITLAIAASEITAALSSSGGSRPPQREVNTCPKLCPNLELE